MSDSHQPRGLRMRITWSSLRIWSFDLWIDTIV